jgi:hypothetical protein
MKRPSNPPRRTWLSWALAALSPWAVARKAEAAPAETASAPATAASKTKPKPSASLTVQVTGDDGRPVPQANVHFVFASGPELDRRTNAKGIVQVQPLPDGPTKVRVWATGWDANKGEIVIKRGEPSVLPIELKR